MNNPEHDKTKANTRPPQTTNKKPKRKSKLMRIITIPIRMLTGVRDMYVRSMNSYADKAPYAAAGMGGVSQPLPRSFSVASARSNDDSDDLADLIRAVSTRDYGDKIDVNAAFLPPSRSTNSGSNNNNTPTTTVSRSGSVRGASAGAVLPAGGDKVVRASSTGRLLMKPPVVGGGGKVPRSASVGMAKIDEDKPCEKFEEDSKSKKKNKKGKKEEVRKESALFPRNKSYKYPGTTTTT